MNSLKLQSKVPLWISAAVTCLGWQSALAGEPCVTQQPFMLENPADAGMSGVATNGDDLVLCESPGDLRIYRRGTVGWQYDGSLPPGSSTGWTSADFVGDRVVIGFSGLDQIRLYEHSGGAWQESQTVTVSDPNRSFGAVMSFDGIDTLFIGSPSFDRGRIYPYLVTPTGLVPDGIILEQSSWVGRAGFGGSIDAADGGVVSVYGASVGDFDEINRGVVSIRRSGGVWQIADLIQPSDGFGSCLDGNQVSFRPLISPDAIFSGQTGNQGNYSAFTTPVNGLVSTLESQASVGPAAGFQTRFALRGEQLVIQSSNGVIVREVNGFGCHDAWQTIETWQVDQLMLDTASSVIADGSLIVVSGNSSGVGHVVVLSNACSDNCLADLAEPFGVLNFFDVTAFLAQFNAGDPVADFAAPFGTLNFFDATAFLAAFNNGCP